MRTACLLMVSLVAMGCTDNRTYVKPYNSDVDEIDIFVTAGPSSGGDATLILMSSSEQIEVGEATISPGNGPVGTEHIVKVEMYITYEDDVKRATLETESTDRGDQEHELHQDASQPRFWTRSVLSQGDLGEERTDVFRFILWQGSDKEHDDAEEWAY